MEDQLLEAIVKKLPSPKVNEDPTLSAMLIDSWYDAYLGVIILVRVQSGKLRKGMKLKMLGTNASYIVEKCGFFTPKIKYSETIETGEIGFLTAGIKYVSDCKVGTLYDGLKPTDKPLWF